jgi:hypothetical protein
MGTAFWYPMMSWSMGMDMMFSSRWVCEKPAAIGVPTGFMD